MLFCCQMDKLYIRSRGFEWDVYLEPPRVIYPHWRDKRILLEKDRMSKDWTKHVLWYYRPVTRLPQRFRGNHAN